jgi:RNA polymerase sigma-70 factor (ECF subfamily)
MSDQELVERHVAGDAGAFEAIVRRHWSEVVSLAARWLGPEGAEGAEDIATEVFVLLHRELPQWRGQASLTTWIYRTTLNKCGNRIQEMRRIRRVSQRLARQSPPAGDPPPDTTVQHREQSRRLQRALESLPERNRTVIVLFHYQNLTFRQIAELLGTSVSTVKRTLVKSFEILKRNLL